MKNSRLTLRYNYRIYPTPEQEVKLVDFGAYDRGLWNLLLSGNQRRYAYDKVRRQRMDFGHQRSNTIARCFDLVVFEDLNVKAMQQCNGHMTRDNLMGQITDLVKYKGHREGGLFHKINRFAASTQPCSQCGALHGLSFNDREFHCNRCGNVQCRDWNSAINIEQIGLEGTNPGWDSLLGVAHGTAESIR